MPRAWPTVTDEDLFWCLQTAEARRERLAEQASEAAPWDPWVVYWDMEIAALDALCSRLRVELFERGCMATPFGDPWPTRKELEQAEQQA